MPRARMAQIPIDDHAPAVFGTVHFRRRFASSLAAKRAVLDALLAAIQARYPQDAEALVLIRLCLDEALVNAVRHGNKEDPAKQVQVEFFGNATRWGVHVADEGEGFTQAEIPDPDDDDTLQWEHGRGLLLMKELMDEVRYHRAGRSLVMVKYLHGAARAP